MERLKIYISLPITGQEEAARQKADALAARLSREGYRPVNPFDIYAGKNPDYFDHLAFDLRAMMHCDGVYFCEGWEHSCGCRIEHDTALALMAHNRKQFKLMYE